MAQPRPEWQRAGAAGSQKGGDDRRHLDTARLRWPYQSPLGDILHFVSLNTFNAGEWNADLERGSTNQALQEDWLPTPFQRLELADIRNFRFCRKCWSQGFHSFAHYVPWITHCPFHPETELRISCGLHTERKKTKLFLSRRILDPCAFCELPSIDPRIVALRQSAPAVGIRLIGEYLAFVQASHEWRECISHSYVRPINGPPQNVPGVLTRCGPVEKIWLSDLVAAAGTVADRCGYSHLREVLMRMPTPAYETVDLASDDKEGAYRSVFEGWRPPAWTLPGEPFEVIRTLYQWAVDETGRYFLDKDERERIGWRADDLTQSGLSHDFAPRLAYAEECSVRSPCYDGAPPSIKKVHQDFAGDIRGVGARVGGCAAGKLFFGAKQQLWEVKCVFCRAVACWSESVLGPGPVRNFPGYIQVVRGVEDQRNSHNVLLRGSWPFPRTFELQASSELDSIIALLLRFDTAYHFFGHLEAEYVVPVAGPMRDFGSPTDWRTRLAARGEMFQSFIALKRGHTAEILLWNKPNIPQSLRNAHERFCLARHGRGGMRADFEPTAGPSWMLG